MIAPSSTRDRLLELATEAALKRHVSAVMMRQPTCHLDIDEGPSFKAGFESCLHPDCAAVREAVPSIPQPEIAWQLSDIGLSANDVYHVTQQWENMPASTEQTRITIALGKLRDALVARGDSPYVSPLPT